MGIVAVAALAAAAEGSPPTVTIIATWRRTDRQPVSAAARTRPRLSDTRPRHCGPRRSQLPANLGGSRRRMSGRTSQCCAEKPYHWHRLLLRACGKQQPGYTAAKNCDELPPPHGPSPTPGEPKLSHSRRCLLGQNRTQAVQQKGFLFDDLVSELLEMRRHVEAKRVCCL